MKRCTKGKSCGGTCISKSRRCRIELPKKLSKGLDELRKELSQPNPSQKPSPTVAGLVRALKLGPLTQRVVGYDFPALKREAERQLAELRAKDSMTSEEIDRARELERELLNAWGKYTSAPRTQLWDRQDAREFDFVHRPTDSWGKYDWSQSYASGAKGLGSGSFGSVMASKSPPPVVVKRGKMSEEEVLILQKLKGKDIAPDLIAADLNKRVIESREGDIRFYAGRVAMSRVPGNDVEWAEDYLSGGGTGVQSVGDSYFSLRKRLHESGIAHNDAHVQNVIRDESGKSRFVDFGLAQDDPRAALSEALGVLAYPRLIPQGAMVRRPLDDKSGDHQAKRFAPFSKFPGWAEGGIKEESNLGKIQANRFKVYTELRKLGLSDDDIAEVVASELRQPISSYNKGAWGKISKQEAMRIIPILYEGVP